MSRIIVAIALYETPSFFVRAALCLSLCLGLCLAAGAAWSQQVTEADDLSSTKSKKEFKPEAASSDKTRMRRLARERRQSQATEDLQRYSGQYGILNKRRAERYLYVTVSCDGKLLAGPLWIEISPWRMQERSDTVFTYSDAYTDISMEFVLDEEGKVKELIHNVEGLTSPAQLIEPLPYDWGDCIPR
ncbi:MAG TPA: hypothetical protein VKN35_04555 [Xanthomonadales bacterium]|nr:hypothetical protein [Xanthomonadales bacterium]